MKKKNLSVKNKILNFYSKKLDDPKIKRIYLSFKKILSSHTANSFCVAVSGGIDSMALSFLAKCYSIENRWKSTLGAPLGGACNDDITEKSIA